MSSGMNPYADSKILHHMDRIVSLSRGVIPAPVHVHLIISDKCNQNCAWCAYRDEGQSSELFVEHRANGTRNENPDRYMPFGKAVEILSDLAGLGVKAIEFTGGGEPTVHPECATIMDKAHSLGLKTALVTNGWQMSHYLRWRLVEGSTWIRVSLDSPDREHYAQARRTTPKAFDETLDNINALVELRDKTKSELTIGVGYVVAKENWEGVIAGTKLARELRVDNIRLSAVFSPDNDSYFDGFGDRAAALCRKATAMSTDTFKVINNFDVRFAELKRGHPQFRFCPQQYIVPYIGADLNVYRCCVLAYTRRGLVGSLADKSFSDVWWSDDHKEDMAQFDARQCPRCQFSDKIEVMNELIERCQVQHPEFV